MVIPKISVIIPIYGTEEFLDKCLLSVRQQTFKNIEIICVDDCSPDDSYKIVEKHQKLDKRVILIRHEKNIGLGGARNTAIRAAKAEYIASVDSDDYMSVNMLETLWDATDDGWFDIVSCGYSRVDASGNVLSKVEPVEKQLSNDDDSIDIFSIIPHAFWNKIWRKSLFVDNDIYFPEHDYYEDMSTTPRILAKARYIKVIKDSLYRYLIRDESIMNSFSDKHIVDYLKGFEIIAEFLRENELTERYNEEFNRYVKGNILYYAKSILSASALIDKKKQYLRFLVLFRITFTENYSSFRSYDIDGLILLLREDDLHGSYFHRNKKSEGTIVRHWSEIEAKAEKIKAMNKIIQNLKEVLTETRNDTEKKLTNCSRVISELYEKEKRFKSDILETRTDLSKTRADLSNVENESVKIMSDLIKVRGDVEIIKEELSAKINRVILLEEEVAEKISIGQMFVVLFFALFTYPVMSKKQSIKLINKPKRFFKDSKSGFAVKYASLFNII